MCGGIALLVARRLHIDLGGLWVVLSALTILRDRFDAALTNARDQLIGTAIGVAFGALFGLLHQAVLGTTLAVFATAFVCGSIATLRGVVNIACVGAAIVLLLPVGKPSYVTAWDRWSDTLIGGGVALLVSAAAAYGARVWPADPTGTAAGS